MNSICSYCKSTDGTLQQLPGVPCSVLSCDICYAVLSDSCRLGCHFCVGFTVSALETIEVLLREEVDEFFCRHVGCGFNHLDASHALTILSCLAPNTIPKDTAQLAKCARQEADDDECDSTWDSAWILPTSAAQAASSMFKRNGAWRVPSRFHGATVADDEACWRTLLGANLYERLYFNGGPSTFRD